MPIIELDAFICIFLYWQWHTWEPSIQNPYNGFVSWSVPENIDINVTLFKDPRQTEFEDKEWTFVIEDVSILHNVNQ